MAKQNPFLDAAIEGGTLVDAGHGVRYVFGKTVADKMTLIVWRGRSQKPVCRGTIRDAEEGLEVVSAIVGEAIERSAKKARLAIAEKAKEGAERERFKVGALLVNSWGYEQTNVDYYQVVARSKSGATVTLRQIEARIFSQPTERQGMSRVVTPSPGVFVGEAFKKRIGAYGVQFRYGGCSLCEEGDTHNVTTYG